MKLSLPFAILAMFAVMAAWYLVPFLIGLAAGGSILGVRRVRDVLRRVADAAVDAGRALLLSLRDVALRAWRTPAFGGAYWTLMTGLGMTGAIFTTFTHSLGITPALLGARVFVHQAVLTNTGWPIIGTIGTNIITTAIPPAQTLTTFDLEVYQMHSIPS